MATTFARRLSSWQAKIAARSCLRGKRKTPYLIANAPAAYVVANLPEARCNGVLAAGILRQQLVHLDLEFFQVLLATPIKPAFKPALVLRSLLRQSSSELMSGPPKKPATLSFQLIREFSTVGKAVQILIQTTAAYRQ